MHQRGEAGEALGDRPQHHQPLLIALLGGEHVGVDGAVELGHAYGLGEEAPHHPLGIGLPLLAPCHEGERSEHGDVALLEVSHDLIPARHRDTAVGEVDEEIGGDLLEEAQALAEARHGIDVEPRARQAHDDAVEVLLVAAEGVIEPADEHDLLGPWVVVALLLEVGLVVAQLGEGHGLIYVVVDIGGAGSYAVRLGGEPALGIHVAANVAGQ